MKKFKCFLLLMAFFLFPNVIYASEVYSLADFVYFDPVSSSTCNDKNYWTPYNQNTTCYRFIVMENADNANSTTLKIMLDHDIGSSTFDNYKVVLEKETSTWSRYKGDIDIIDENTIYELMKLSQRPTLDNISVNGGVNLGFFMTNTMYMMNRKTYSNYGYWSKDLYEENEKYAYTVTENANNRLVEKTKTRGIRPVIVIDKSLLKKTTDVTNIDSLIKNGMEYKYMQTSQTDDNYRHLQGFTLTKDKLVFHSIHIGNPDLGLLFVYEGQNYQTLHKYDYGNTAHGNDMTYNSNTNKVLLLVKGIIYEYNGDTLTYEKSYTVEEQGDLTYGAIGYDAVNDHYYAYNNQRIYVLNNNFEKLYSFDYVTLGVRQGLEYHNGYIYASTSESKCPNMYQLYCFDEEWSSTTYVYNVKLKADGTPSKDFGRLVDKLYIGPGIGELESVSFNNDQMYFGYATRKTDVTYLYKFYSIPYSKIAYEPENSIKYIEEDNSKTITINSNEELKNILGWTISDDLHSISKKITENTPSSTITLCDLYNNCTNVALEEIKFEDNDENEEDSILDEYEKEEQKDNTIEENIGKNPETGSKIYLIVFLTLILLIIIYKYRKKIYDVINIDR